MAVGAILFGVLFVGVGALVAGFGVWEVRNARTIAASDPASIWETVNARGPVEFEGVATDHGAFEAPFTGEPAVFCTYRIEERRSKPGSDSGSEWRTVRSGSVAPSFRVADDTGRVEVDPSGATVNIGRQRRVESVSSGDRLPDETRRRIAALDDELEDRDAILAEGTRRRYYEARIEPGDEVHVYGGTTDRDLEHDGVDATVSPPADGHYRITVGDESDAVSSASRSGFYWILGGLFFGLFGIGFVLVALGLV